MMADGRAARGEHLVWLDLEMTGLDPGSDAIVEMAIAITALDDFTELETFETAIHQPEAVLRQSSDRVLQMHERSGLYGRVRSSPMTIDAAEHAALAVVSRWCEERQGILAGNSIWQDRRFLERYMPTFEAYLHYRQVDVTSFKVVVRSWYGPLGVFEKIDKSHTALADVRNSIAELDYYRHLFLHGAAHARRTAP
jgi:oligoribonuclease